MGFRLLCFFFGFIESYIKKFSLERGERGEGEGERGRGEGREKESM